MLDESLPSESLVSQLTEKMNSYKMEDVKNNASDG